MAQKQYKNYMALKCKLQRSSKVYPCLKQYAALATVLLDTFLRNNGYLSSKDYYKSKFEVQNKSYTDWINELKEAHVLVQYKTEGSKGSDFIRFSAGPLIVEYINAEKTKTREIALVADVPSKAEFEELKSRMCKVEEAVQELHDASKPPDDSRKQEIRKNATERLAKLALVNSN